MLRIPEGMRNVEGNSRKEVLEKAVENVISEDKVVQSHFGEIFTNTKRLLIKFNLILNYYPWMSNEGDMGEKL